MQESQSGRAGFLSSVEELRLGLGEGKRKRNRSARKMKDPGGVMKHKEQPDLPQSAKRQAGEGPPSSEKTCPPSTRLERELMEETGLSLEQVRVGMMGLT